MPAEPPLTGDALLEAVSSAMVEFHQRYHHREPAHARTQLMEGDMLACVMGGVYTEIEKTLIELRRETIVNDARSAFQDAMGPRLIAEVERLSGRNVVLFFSKSHVAPDLEIEIFLLGRAIA